MEANQVRDIIQKAFDEGKIDTLTYLKANVQYDELVKGGPGSGEYIHKKGVKIEPARYVIHGQDGAKTRLQIVPQSKNFVVFLERVHPKNADGTYKITKKDPVFYDHDKYESFIEDLKNRGGKLDK